MFFHGMSPEFPRAEKQKHRHGIDIDIVIVDNQVPYSDLSGRDSMTF
jgi:hypothetical protein